MIFCTLIFPLERAEIPTVFYFVYPITKLASISLIASMLSAHLLIIVFERTPCTTDAIIMLSKCSLPHFIIALFSSNSFKLALENLAKLCDRLLAYNHEFETIEDLEKIVNTFNENINNEVSQSHNRVVNEVFEYEKEYLLPLPNNKIFSSYLSNRQTRKVAKDSMISYKSNKYSVPVKYIGFDLNVIEKDNSLYIYDNTNLIRCHQISNNPLNYNKDDVKDILVSDLLKDSTEEKIEEFISNNLRQYDNLL